MELRVRPLRRGPCSAEAGDFERHLVLVFQVWEKLTANRIQLLLLEHRHWGEEMRLGCH